MKEPKTYEAQVDDRTAMRLDVDELENLDILSEGEGAWHVLIDGKGYHIELLSVDVSGKTYHLNVNGNRHQVRLADPYDVLIDQLGLAKKIVHAVREIKAPMPGLVREVLVADGQTVAENEPLLILEAMKMENVIKSPTAGVIRSVSVVVNAPVDKGQVLISFE